VIRGQVISGPEYTSGIVKSLAKAASFKQQATSLPQLDGKLQVNRKEENANNIRRQRITVEEI
jgi:hypothetical protein